MKNHFKESKSKSNRVNLIKTFAYSIVFWILFLVIFPIIIKSVESRYIDLLEPSKILGGFSFVMFSSLNIWSAIVMSCIGKGTPLPMDCASELVIKGPYKYVRNPMAVGGIGQGISIGLYIGSFFTITYALIGAIIWHLFVRPTEERDLENRFGEEFLKYKAKIRTWIPKFNL